MKYKVGEIVEGRSTKYIGWREIEVLEAYPKGIKTTGDTIRHYIVSDASGENCRVATDEPYMRRKSDSNDTDGTSIEEMMKSLNKLTEAVI